MLEDAEAFKARARTRAVYTPDPLRGRPLLPAALSLEAMVTQLLSWAALMPLFATHLTGMFNWPTK